MIALIFVLAFICEYIDCSLGMGYGTILSPILILLGYDPLLVVPSILISQALSGFSATLFHSKLGNVNLNLKGNDVRVAFFIVSSGILATILSAFIAISLPKFYLTAYIGLLVTAMGILLLSKRTFRFSWRKVCIIGVLSAFNKVISGGGFGPVVTSGQMISGNKARSSVGVTTMSEVPICLLGFVMYLILKGLPDISLPVILCLGAVLATPFGPVRTSRLNEQNARTFIGALTLSEGILMLIKLFVSF